VARPLRGPAAGFELGRLKRSCFVLQDGIDKPSVPFAALKDADFVLAQIWIGGETGHHKILRIGDRRDTCPQSRLFSNFLLGRIWQ
jgi:hypothetical protein